MAIIRDSGRKRGLLVNVKQGVVARVEFIRTQAVE